MLFFFILDLLWLWFLGVRLRPPVQYFRLRSYFGGRCSGGGNMFGRSGNRSVLFASFNTRFGSYRLGSLGIFLGDGWSWGCGDLAIAILRNRLTWKHDRLVRPIGFAFK